MSTPYVGEIRIFGFNFAPNGWLQCNGQLLPINQYTALFSLIGTYYGGNGISTFQLPNLQGQVPIHQGTGGGGSYVIGQIGGTENVTLLYNNMPIHTHTVNAVTSTSGNVAQPSGAFLASVQITGETKGGTVNTYSTVASNAQMSPTAITTAGGSIPHNNMQPYLVVNFCIAINGVFPSRG